MRDSGCRMRDGSPMFPFHPFDENIELSTEEIELPLQVAVDLFVRQRPRVEKSVKMVDRFIAGGMGEDQKANKFLFVPAPSVALDNVRANRFYRAPNLACLLVHLELRQLVQGHPMHRDRGLPRQLPNLQVAITHGLFRISDPASRITLRIRPRAELASAPESGGCTATKA